jgi:hypothetical protein
MGIEGIEHFKNDDEEEVVAVEEGIFPHQCIHPDCTKIVQFDDEPWCFTHSPDEGSSVFGWSARKALTETADRQHVANEAGVKHNVFEKGS